MRMLSDRIHWSALGLALLTGVSGVFSDRVHAQPPVAGGHDAPTSYSFPGPAPAGCDTGAACDTYVPGGYPSGGLFGGGVLRGPFGGLSHGGGTVGNGVYGYTASGACGSCGSGSCGGTGACGIGTYGGYGGASDDGLLGNGPISNYLSSIGLGGGACASGSCGAVGCAACGGAGCGGCRGGLGIFGALAGNGALFSGNLTKFLLGPLAPYSDGAGSQRYFDVYAGTIAFTRTSGFHGVASAVQDLAQTSPVFEQTDIISTLGVNGTPVLFASDLNLDRLRYGLELIGNVQTGPGANIEVRYFGLNNWNDTVRTQSVTPDLYSLFSMYGTDPVGGFDDTDRSFIHQISYDSKFDNGEVNYRRRWVAPNSAFQGSWLGGIRYFELDETFGFGAIGSFDNTFTFDQLRFFNMDTKTRNHLVGFQLGTDLWVNVIPGFALGSEIRAGVYNNYSKVNTGVWANSVPGGPIEPGATEQLSKNAAAFVVEYSAQAVYRLTYSWSVRGAYNLLYVDQVALAPENFNARDMANALPNSVFGLERYPFIDADGQAVYHGFSLGAEYLW